MVYPAGIARILRLALSLSAGALRTRASKERRNAAGYPGQMSRLRKSRPSCPGLFAEKVIEWLYWDIPQFGVLRSRTLLARAQALSCYANVALRFLVLTRTPCVQPWLASSSHGALGYDQLILQRRRMRSMRSFALAADPGRRRSSSGRAARARAARRQRSRPRLLLHHSQS